jgi:hypothetical protein
MWLETGVGVLALVAFAIITNERSRGRKSAKWGEILVVAAFATFGVLCIYEAGIQRGYRGPEMPAGQAGTLVATYVGDDGKVVYLVTWVSAPEEGDKHTEETRLQADEVNQSVDLKSATLPLSVHMDNNGKLSVDDPQPSTGLP